jgi:hypothetical protein
VFSEVQLLPATLKSFRRGYPHRTGHHLPAAGRPGPRLYPGAGRPGRRRAHPGRHEPGRLGPRHRPQPGVFTETFAHSDQLACIACGQQWRATSLRGRWWQCPNRCNQSAAYQRTGHLPVTDRVDRATTPGRLPLAPGRGRDQAGGQLIPRAIASPVGYRGRSHPMAPLPPGEALRAVSRYFSGRLRARQVEGGD